MKRKVKTEHEKERDQRTTKEQENAPEKTGVSE
jgi:hypothetical protein